MVTFDGSTVWGILMDVMDVRSAAKKVSLYSVIARAIKHHKHSTVITSITGRGAVMRHHLNEPRAEASNDV